MKKTMLLIVTALFAVNFAFADSLEVGEKLPSVTIEKKGQMVIESEVVDNIMILKDGTGISYETFNSDDLTGKIRTVYYMAARNGIEDINQPFIDGLIAAKLPEFAPDGAYKTTTILNTDDAMWGTSGIAAGRLEDSQKETAYAFFVVDSEGLGLKKWGLKAKGTAIIVLDREGKVLYFKDGEMSADEIASTVALIEKHLAM
jgi:YtfJ family uncharacterized protein